VATVDECRQALHNLAAQLEAKGASTDLDRSLACRVTDLDAAFHARLTGGRLIDIADGDDPKAKIKLTASSDDLVAMLNGHLDVAKAVASRRVSISASPFDLLKLRKLL
jgi:putative sterol carrier protein